MTPILLRGGRVYDGTGSAGRDEDVLIEDGRVRAVGPGLVAPEGARVLDASRCWVTPGFIDNHTHYDAELEVAPALTESVRHGVTTVTIGSCGLGMALGEPEDLADMFCRVEGVPRAVVKPLLERVKDWKTPAEYLDHLDRLPLGPHVAVLLGHSTLRAAVLGLGRSLDPRTSVSSDERRQMVQLLEEALDAGFVGLSVNTLRWDKMDGEQFRSRPTPSTFAPWSEYRMLNRSLRARGRVWQGVPNISTKINLLGFLLESAAIGRPALRTAIISLVDAKANRSAAPLAGFVANFFNRVLGAKLRFQSLPNLFDFYTDGMDVPIFEEIGAGTELLHLTDPSDRKKLLLDPEHRAKFRRQWTNPLAGRAYHRDLGEARVVDCPDAQVVGKSFAEIARERSVHPVDAMLDLLAEHGDRLRWYTVLGNDRPALLRWIVRHPAVLVGFSDAGAHLRNMAHYHFPLRLLALEMDGGDRAIARAVHRLTMEQTEFLGISGGRLAPGERADVAVVDPAALDGRLDAIEEQPLEGFAGLKRWVRRPGGAVRWVLIRGQIAFADGEISPELGKERGFGAVARASDRRPD